MLHKLLESCAGHVNRCGLQVPTFVGQVQEPSGLCVPGGRRLSLVQGGRGTNNSFVQVTEC